MVFIATTHEYEAELDKKLIRIAKLEELFSIFTRFLDSAINTS